MTQSDGVGYLLSRWVHDSDETQENESALNEFDIVDILIATQLPSCECNHPKGVAGHLQVDLSDAVAVTVTDLDHLSILDHMRDEREVRADGAFGEHPAITIHLVDGRHSFAFPVECELTKPGVLPAMIFGIFEYLPSEYGTGAVGGISNRPPLFIDLAHRAVLTQ